MLYRLAYPGGDAEFEKIKAAHSVASRWFHSQKVQTYIAQEKVLAEKRKEDERARLEAEIVERLGPQMQTDESRAGIIDFTNPENQKRRLNQIVSKASTTGEALDALKIIIQTQRDDRQAAHDQQRPRYYLPMRCEVCPLYEKAKSNLNKNSK